MIRSATLWGLLLVLWAGCGQEHQDDSARSAAAGPGAASAALAGDTTPPTISFQQPYDGEPFSGVNSVEVVVGVSDSMSSIASVRMGDIVFTSTGSGVYKANLPTPQEGRFTYQVVATDSAGNTATSPVRAVFRDDSAPVITITEPSSFPAYIGDTSVHIKGRVTDLTLQTFYIGNENPTVGPDGSFDHVVTLTSGQQRQISVGALDRKQHRTSMTLEIWSNTTPPSLTVTAPSKLLNTQQSSVTVQGRVQGGFYNANPQVTIAGQQATLNANKEFTQVVNLVEGSNTILVRATDVYGLQKDELLTVKRDTQPPVITVEGVPTTSPAPAPVNLKWSVSDVTDTTVVAKLDGNTVNGDAVSVSTSGSHTLTITAKDYFNQSSTVSRSFVIDNQPPVVQVTGAPASGRTNASEVRLHITATDDSAVQLRAELNASSVFTGSNSLDVTVSAERKHILVITAKDAANNEAAPQTLEFTIDRSSPVITVTGVPPSGASQTSVSLGWTVSDATATTVVARLDGTVVTQNPCSVSAVGPHTLSIEATDSLNPPAFASHAFVIDSQPPVVQVTGVPATGRTNASEVLVHITATDATAVQLRAVLDTSSVFTGTNSLDVTVRGEQKHTLLVTAKDAADNEASSQSFEFTIDRSSPVITVTGVPSGEVSSLPVNLGWTVSDATATTVVAKVDDVVVTQNPYLVSEPGRHTLSIEATDSLNPPAKVSHAFVIDTEPPVVTVVGIPASGRTNASEVQLHITATDATAVQLRAVLDTVGIHDGSNSLDLTVSGEQRHTLVVTAKDAFDHEALPQSFEFIIDRSSPVITVTGVPSGEVSSLPVNLGWTVSDATTTTVVTKVDDVVVTQNPYFVSEPGRHTLSIEATDSLNPPAKVSRSFVIDTEPPVVTVVGIPASGRTNASEVQLHITATDATAVQLRAVLDTVGIYDGSNSLDLIVDSERRHTLVVTAKDAVNHEALAQSFEFTIDRSPPVLQLTGVNPDAVVKAPVTLTATATDAFPGTLVLTVDGTEHTTSQTQLSVVVSDENSHQVTVSATDEFGHDSALGPVDFILDFTAPTLSIQGLPPGRYSSAAQVTPVIQATDDHGIASVVATLNNASFTSGTAIDAERLHVLSVTALDQAQNSQTETVEFVLDRTRPDVIVSGVEPGGRYNTAVTPAVSFADPNLDASSKRVTLDGLPFTGDSVSADGEHVLVAFVRDLALNEKEVEVRFFIDRSKPELTLVSPTAGRVLAATSTPVTLRALDNGPIESVKVGTQLLVPTPNSPLFTGTLPLDVEGTNSFEAVAFDEAGNSQPLSFSFVRDTTKPKLTVTSPADQAVVGESFVEFQGTIEDATAVTLSINNGTASAVAPPGTFSRQVTLEEGDNTFTLTATDEAGHTDTKVLHIKASLQPPTLVVREPASSSLTKSDSVTVKGNVKATSALKGVTLTVNGKEVTPDAQGDFQTSVALVLGTNTLTVRAENTAQRSSQVILDVTRIRDPQSDGGTTDAGTVRDAGSTGDAGTSPSSDAGSSGGGSSSSDSGTSGSGSGSPPISVSDAGTDTSSSPVLVVEAPEPGLVLGGSSVAVYGRVEGGTPPFQLTISGTQVAVNARSFSASFSLADEGEHTLRFRVKDARGREATVERAVSVDRTQPELSVLQPDLKGGTSASVDRSPYYVRGQVSDTHLATVEVNDVEARVVGGSFMAAIPILQATTPVKFHAVDLAGNSRTLRFSLLAAQLPPSVVILQPQDGFQSSEPVVNVRAQVSTVGGTTVEHVYIQTKEIQPEGGVYAAQVPLSLGSNTLTVRAVDNHNVETVQSVQVQYRSVTDQALAVTGVAPEASQQGVQPDSLLSVSFNKPILAEHLAEGFLVKRNNQALPGGYSVAPGGQTLTFIARDPLPEGERLVLEVNDKIAPAAGPKLARSFTSDFRVRPALTRVRGVVTDADFRPLAGVTVVAEGRGQSTVTGPDGNWTLFANRGGEFVLRYEGPVTSDGRAFPTVRRRLYVVEGGETVERPLALTPEDKASSQQVDAVAALHLDFANRHPGLSVDVPAHGLFFADGAVRGVLTATEVAVHTLPVPMEGRAALEALWQIGPAGVRVEGPVSFTVPNRTGLPVGRRALLVGYDAQQHQLRRLGFGKVRAGGSDIALEQPLALGSIEWLGYMPLDEAQDQAVARALASASGSGSTPATPTDAGTLGLWLPGERESVPGWKRALDLLLIGEAHAQVLGGVFLPAFSALDDEWMKKGPAYVEGFVRAPRERYLLLELEAPTPAQLKGTRSVTLPYTLPLKLAAHFENPDPLDLKTPPTVALTVAAVATLGGSPPTMPPGKFWQASGQSKASLDTGVVLPVGTTRITLTTQAIAQTRRIVLEAKLTAGDGGTEGTLELKRVEGETNEEDESVVLSPIRFKGLPVTVTGPGNGEQSTTGPKGGYGVPVLVPGREEMAISCTQVPVGPKLVERVDEQGTVHLELSKQEFGVCSPTYTLYPARSVRADIVVDVRMIHGLLKFADRSGKVLDADCDEEATSVPSATEPGAFTSIGRADLGKTEVHFFRQDDLLHPIAKFAVGEVNPRACEGGGYIPKKEFGQYQRVRVGPAGQSKAYARERCAELERTDGGQSDGGKSDGGQSDGGKSDGGQSDGGKSDGGRSPEDDSYYEANCAENRSNYLRLAAGDRLVVFAINHATGYAGTTTVTVPAINRDTRDDNGNCAEDDALGGPLQVTEFGETLSLSRCTMAELGIPADITLYPPEMDIRVARRRTTEGIASTMTPSLVRHGGAATTSDDYLQVATHWRVRQLPVPPAGEGTDGGGVDAGSVDAGPAWFPDGGFNAPGWCAHDRYLPDGGACPPDILSDVGDGGLPLEVYCSELPASSPQRILGLCMKDAPQLVEVPQGIPPLAGRVVRVTGTAVEQPAVVTFPVRPGSNTVSVQASLRYQTTSGQKVTLSALPRANYYVHVVGQPVLQRDLNGDGLLQATEQNAPPPDFTDDPKAGSLPGLPRLAVGLKDVYRWVDAEGTVAERYDRAREHEFRVMQWGDAGVTAVGNNSSRPLEGSKPAATDDDLAYEFLMSDLLMPQDPSRAGTLSGEFVLRLGTDNYGIDCPIKIDPTTRSLSGTCDSEFLPEILSASDVLYFELYLSGNAENVLYRFNFQGLTPRYDFVTASREDTVEQSLAKEPVASMKSRGFAVIDRPIARLPVAQFAIAPSNLPAGSGTIRICVGSTCDKPEALLKSARLKLKSDGSYEISEQKGRVANPIQQLAVLGANKARRFAFKLPNDVGSMIGADSANEPIFLKIKPDPFMSGASPPDELDIILGEPQGRYNFVNAWAAAQPTIAGVNTADGHLSFQHEDFAVPQFNETVQFVRTFNNQNNTLGVLGSGWSHNYEGYVYEEKEGRYSVMLNGQSYDFPICESINEGMVSQCRTDGTHGGTLTVYTKDRLDVTFKANTGWIYKFDRESILSMGENGHRWVLTAYSDGNEAPRPGGEDMATNYQPYDLTQGWTRVEYVADSDRVSSVRREPGKLITLFSYEPVNRQADGYISLVRLKARTENYERLSEIGLYKQTDVTDINAPPTDKALYRVKYSLDERGNLTRAEQQKNNTSARRAWAYNYRTLPNGTTGYARWRLSNELSTARMQITNEGQANPQTFYDQWGSKYESSGDASTYRYVDVLEFVSKVTLSDQGPGAFQFGLGYPRFVESRSREVTLPDGVTVELKFDKNGRGVSQATGLKSPIRTAWNPNQSTPSQVTTEDEAVLSFDIDERHHVKGQSLVSAPQDGSSNPAGIKEGGGAQPLMSQTVDPRFGAPTSRQVRAHDGKFLTIDTPLTTSGQVASVRIKNSSGTTVYAAGPRMFEPRTGVLLSETDGEGKVTTYVQDDQSLGLTSRVITTHPGNASQFPGLKTLTREMQYDNWGRATSVRELETGAQEKWTYDGLGRVLTHTVAGEPDQKWSYKHIASFMRVDVNEYVGDDTETQLKPNKISTVYVLEDPSGGKVTRETRFIGLTREPAVRTSFTQNGHLVRTTDATGTWNLYEYDASGQLLSIKAATELGTKVQGEVARFGNFDATGNPRDIFDQNGLLTAVKYDYLGRPVYWNYGAGDVESVQLDVSGAVSFRKFGATGSEHTLEMTPHPLGYTQSVTSTGETTASVSTSSQFDAMGRPASSRDEVTGQEEVYEYNDVLGRLTLLAKRIPSSGSVTLNLEETRTYKYETVSEKVRLVVTTKKEIETGLASSPKRTESFDQVFDSAGRLLRLVSTVDGKNSETKYEYNARGNLVSTSTLTSSTGNVWATTTFTYDDAGHVVSKVEPGNAKTTLKVDGEGRVVLQEGPHPKEMWEFEYDSLGRLSKKTLKPVGDNEAPSVWTYAYPRWTAETLGFQDKAFVETDPLGRKTTRLFNARYKLASEIRSDEVSNSADVPTSDNKRTTVLSYDGPWLKKSVVTALPGPETTTFEQTLDARGRTLHQEESWARVADSLGAYLYVTDTAWTGRSAHVTQKWTVSTLSSESSPGSRTLEKDFTIAVDGAGNLISRRQGALRETWLYDAAGLLSEASPAVSESAMAARPTTRYTYTQGRLKQVSNKAGSLEELTQYTYRPDGQLETVTEPTGRQRRFTYDYLASGSATTEEYGLGADTEKVRYEYDTGGYLKRKWQAWDESNTPDKREWAFEHGPRGELRKVTLPPEPGGTSSVTFEYKYNGLGELTKIVAPGVPVQTFAYDYLGRPRSRSRGTSTWTTQWLNSTFKETSPNNQTASGATAVDQDETVVSLDGRGRILRKTLQPGPGTAAYKDVSQVLYSYDGLGQPLAVKELRQSGNVINTFSYDERNRLTEVKRNSETVSYSYLSDSDLLEWQESGPSAARRTLTYEYDGFQRLKKLTTARGVTSIELESGGERLLRVSDASATECYGYDGRGWLTSVRATASNVACNQSSASPPLSNFKYSYDGRGNRLSEQYQQGSADVQVTRYGYDAADRLTGVRYPENGGTAELYALGADGTRLGRKQLTGYASAMALGAAAFTAELPASVNQLSHEIYSYDATGGLSGLTQVVNATEVPVRSFTTDASGRLRRDADLRTPKSNTYNWNSDGRLARVSVIRGATQLEVLHAYDYAGLRRSTTRAAGTTNYLWAAGQLIEEQLPNGRALLHEQVGERTLAAGEERVLADGLGSVVASLAGTPKRYQYGVWGEYRNGSGPSANESSLGYTGHSFEADSGLVYAQQRWYSPELGRFLSEDPVGATAFLGTPQAMNSWAYANANPVKYKDPDGRIGQAALMAITGGVLGCASGALFATEGERLAGCGKGLLVGAASGLATGLTLGLIRGGAGLVWGSRAFTVGGELRSGALAARVIAEGVGGAVGGAGNVLINGGSLEDASAMGWTSAFTNAVSGFIPPVAARLLGPVTQRLAASNPMMRLAATGFGQAASRVGRVAGRFRGPLTEGGVDALSQRVSMWAGVQDEFDYKQTLFAMAMGADSGATDPASCKGGVCRAPGSCFVAGTPVLTREGLKPIEQVQVDDEVWSRDDKTGESDWRRVAQTFVRHDKPVLDVEMHAADGQADTLAVTGEHPFWVQNKGWMDARNLSSGDFVLSAHGGWLRVGRATWRQTTETVYNFEVEDFHTYFVGKLSAWVHNTCLPKHSELSDNVAWAVKTVLDRMGVSEDMHKALGIFIHEHDGRLSGITIALSGPPRDFNESLVNFHLHNDIHGPNSMIRQALGSLELSPGQFQLGPSHIDLSHLDQMASVRMHDGTTQERGQRYCAEPRLCAGALRSEFPGKVTSMSVLWRGSGDNYHPRADNPMFMIPCPACNVNQGNMVKELVFQGRL